MSTTFIPNISAFASVECDCFLGFNLNLQESALVNFEMRVRETRPPDNSVSAVPIRFTAFASVAVNGPGVGASAYVRASSSSGSATAGDLFEALASTLLIDGPDWRPSDVVDITESVNILIGQINFMTVAAGCRLKRDDDPDGSVECFPSQADVSFDFDQAAFDERMGEATFALAEHYSIELSPGLVPTLIFNDGFELEEAPAR